MPTPTTATVSLVCLLSSLAAAQPERDTPNLNHDRHTHAHNPKHATVPAGGPRFFTTRASEVELPLPTEESAFTFAVFGDRTGGPDEGVNILADAVRDVNLFEPDLVMTVGDLIQGYRGTDRWMSEMREYKSIMNRLLCPWFPTPGNHDTYWRQGPAGGHDADYEAHFGPLWYSFTHKDCSFIVLYTDEGDPKTGEKSFRSQNAQRMSDEQLEFLSSALERGKDADHQFVFVHHPRWLGGGYGSDWNDKVHPALIAAGNVTAVFAGHIHRMRNDAKDGIEYVTLATVGGGQRGSVPDAGFLHHYNIITVRPDQVAMAAVPVGAALDVRDLTGTVHMECAQLAQTPPEIQGVLPLAPDGSADTTVTITLDNPTTRTVEYTLSPTTSDFRNHVYPDHTHGALNPGQTTQLRFRVARSPDGLDAAFDSVRFALDREYLTDSRRYTIPTTEAAVPVTLDATSLGAPSENLALHLDGEDNAVPVPSAVASIPDGPFTLECWFRPEAFGSRVGLLAKTEGSEFGIFVNNGNPEFAVHLGDRYRSARAADITLQTDEWSHIAGVFEGQSVRLFVNGQMVARTEVPPGLARSRNRLPFYIGADVGRAGGPNSFAHGLIDEVRLTTSALYTGPFSPQRRLEPGPDSAFHYTFDHPAGSLIIDSGPEQAHTTARGRPRTLPAD